MTALVQKCTTIAIVIGKTTHANLHQEKDPYPPQPIKAEKNLTQARFPAFQLHRVDDVFLSLLIWFK